MHDCLIAFGSNEGDPNEIFQQAVLELGRVESISVTSHSKPFVTKPVGGPEGQDPYLNAAIRIKTTLSPTHLHDAMTRIESSLGRERRERWGARKIDLDLLIFGDLELESERLTIPHPRMSFRRFVLDPGAEVAADMVHPTSGLTIGELVECLERPNSILLIDPSGSPEFETMIRQALPPNWKLETTNDLGSFSGSHDRFKLACFVQPIECVEAAVRDDAKTQDSSSSPLQFRGPALRLSREEEKSRTEILAAIDAIS